MGTVAAPRPSGALDLLSLLKRAKEEHDATHENILPWPSSAVQPQALQLPVIGIPPMGPGTVPVPIAAVPMAIAPQQPQPFQIAAQNSFAQPPSAFPSAAPIAPNGFQQFPQLPFAQPFPQPFQPPPWTPGQPLRSLSDVFLWLEALPPQVPRGSLSKLEMQGRAIALLNVGCHRYNSVDLMHV